MDHLTLLNILSFFRMDEFEVYEDTSVKESRKNELPAIEMQVTQLVECQPPILSATASGKVLKQSKMHEK